MDEPMCPMKMAGGREAAGGRCEGRCAWLVNMPEGEAAACAVTVMAAERLATMRLAVALAQDEEGAE